MAGMRRRRTGCVTPDEMTRIRHRCGHGMTRVEMPCIAPLCSATVKRSCGAGERLSQTVCYRCRVPETVRILALSDPWAGFGFGSITVRFACKTTSTKHNAAGDSPPLIRNTRSAKRLQPHLSADSHQLPNLPKNQRKLPIPVSRRRRIHGLLYLPCLPVMC